MDGAWFVAALERTGASQADLARHLGLAPSAVSRMLKGERQMKPSEAIQIAAFLGVSRDEVVGRAGSPAPAAASEEALPRRRGRPPTSRASLAPRAPLAMTQIPIRGGTGMEVGTAEHAPVGYTGAPASFAGVRAAYAIYMRSEAMEPRYEQGWLLHVNPNKPPTRGRDVVIYKKDRTVLIKQFVRWENDTLVVGQLNPPAGTAHPERPGG
jgi:phage repressor protein C with HTH and peptisase S24 domain